MQSINSLQLELFKDVDKAVNHLKNISAKEIKLIVSGKFYSEFVTKFKENIKDMHISPKIIIFTDNKEEFLKDNKNFLKSNNMFFLFYTIGGIATSFEEIKNFLMNKNQNTKLNINRSNSKDEKNNFILGTININKDDINKDILIINSYENATNNTIYSSRNEKEIKENIEIKIDGKNIEFSYFHKFEKEGNYEIEYIFKNNLTNTNFMFSQCKNLVNLDLSNIKSENVHNMEEMFSYCQSLTSLNLSHLNTKKVKIMDKMFLNCQSLTNLDLSNFNTDNAYTMKKMFFNCKSLTNLELSNFNTENVNTMREMFSNCQSLTNIDLSNFNTKKVEDMVSMFNNCKSLKNLNLSSFNTENVTNMGSIFSECESLINLDLSNSILKMLQKWVLCFINVNL